MNLVQDITASIVLYKSDDKVRTAIDNFLRMPGQIMLYLVDNSPDQTFIQRHADLERNQRVRYIFNNKNLGYGSAHNIALREAVQSSKYHMVLNPDVEFAPEALRRCLEYMDTHENIGLLMPKILYPDGSTQYLCKMLPGPFDLIMRRFIPRMFSKILQERLDRYELRHKDYDRIMEVPNLSGCFMVLRCAALKTVGLFDERFFMYLEDTDLSRRINSQYQTIYYPEVAITHNYEKGSYKNYKLLKYHVRSAFAYFSKWGWLIDSSRSTINKILSA